MSFSFLEFEKKIYATQLAARYSLAPLYKDYAFGESPVSTPGMAASFETLILLFCLCQYRNPRSILDLGSGISSAAFRKWRQATSSSATIVSVDSSVDWLEKSRTFCAGQLGESDDFVVWGDPAVARNSYDVILFDIDMATNRKLFFDDVFTKLAGPGALIVVDDMHKPVMQVELPKYLQSIAHKQHDITKYTYDCFSRYATLVELT